MNKSKGKKTLFLALFCVCFLTLAHISGMSILVYGALAVFLAIMAFCKDEYVIPLFLFFLPWSTVLKTSPTSISFCSIAIILVFMVFCFFKGQSQFDSGLIFTVGGIFVITLMSTILHNYGIATSYIMFIFMLAAYPMLIRWLRDKIDFETCTIFYSLGIISATLISFLFSSNQNLMAYIKILEGEEIQIVRYSGFYADPNFYAAQVVTAIGCQCVVISQKRQKTAWNIITVLMLVVCGASSVSKSFLICLSIVLAVWLYCLTKQNSAKFLKVLFGGAVIIAVVLASGVFSNVIDEYLVRFGMAEDASSLTTGRSDLWKEYLDFMFNNPKELIWGQGYTSVFNSVRKGSHNTLIQALYQLGIIGIVFLAFWLRRVVKATGAKAVSFSQTLLLLVSCFSMWMGLDMLFFDDFFLTIVLFALGIQYVSENKNNDDIVATQV